MARDTARAATTQEVKDLRRQTSALKEVLPSDHSPLPVRHALAKLGIPRALMRRHLLRFSEILPLVR